MKRCFLILLLTGLAPIFLFTQNEPILISEQTIKVTKAKQFYFGFAEGDEIIFNLEVLKGKTIKEIEILEYPSTSKLFDFKSRGVKEYRIKINKTAIYQFRIEGSGLGTKICKIKVIRIPGAKETVSFDTSVDWKIRYDSIYIQKYRKDLIKVDTTFVDVLDRIERVHSTTNLSNSNISKFNVQLPLNKKEGLKKAELISWAYWVGVGNEGQKAYEEEKKNFLLQNVSTISSLTNPLIGVALGAYTILVNQPKGDNIKYWFTTYQDGKTYNITSGNSVVSTGRVTNFNQGGFTITLENDNLTNGINVNVKISAVLVTKHYINQPYRELRVSELRYPVLRPNN